MAEKKKTTPTAKKKAPAKKPPTKQAQKAEETPPKSINCQLPGWEEVRKGKSVAEVVAEVEKELSHQHDRFCREYIIEENAVRSYQFAYPSATYFSAANSALDLLKKPEIQQRIQELRDERNKRLDISGDKVLKRLAALVNFDPRKLYDPDGRLRNIPDLDHDVALCVQSIEVDELFSGRGEERTAIGLTKKVKFVDAKTVIELIGRNLSLWKDVGSKENPLVGTVEEVSNMSDLERANRMAVLITAAQKRMADAGNAETA